MKNWLRVGTSRLRAERPERLRCRDDAGMHVDVVLFSRLAQSLPACTDLTEFGDDPARSLFIAGKFSHAKLPLYSEPLYSGPLVFRRQTLTLFTIADNVHARSLLEMPGGKLITQQSLTSKLYNNPMFLKYNNAICFGGRRKT